MILVLEGPNGCGKTHFREIFFSKVRKLTDHQQLKVNELSIKRDTSLSGGDLNRLITRRQFDMPDMTMLRLATGHLELITKARHMTKNGGLAFIDRGVPSFFVYQSKGQGREQAEALFKHFLMPTLDHVKLVYFDVSSETLKERVKSRGDANHLLGDLEEIRYRYVTFFKNIRRPDYLVTESSDLSELADQILHDAFN